ncbi:MAG: CBS domain-containing protein [Clostridia bacterium]|nr:MAG: CBS domain-containing protein [Clostridia bacterium]
MGDRPKILIEDLEAALQRLGEVVDVTAEDLLKIFHLTVEEMEKRNRMFRSKERIGEVMKSPVITCTPDTSLKEAARILLEKNIHCLPVLGEGGKLVGIVTESDLMFQFSPGTSGDPFGGLLARRKGKKGGQRVGEIMTKRVVTVHPEDPIKKAINLMLKHGYGRIPVVDLDGLLVGIVAHKDILEFIE